MTLAVPQHERLPPPPLADSAERTVRELAALSASPALEHVNGATLLMERAVSTGARFRRGRSAGGACRLLPARDRTIAVNLPRRSDWELVPAWLDVNADRARGWGDVAAVLREREDRPLIERAHLLGLAAAATGDRTPPAPDDVRSIGAPVAASGRDRPLVIDLSALWAGPLCGHLLHLAGADVVKVESTRRPDGGRRGNATFYAILNQGKRCVALDLAAPHGQSTLRDLIRHADIVIEASRPRALRQMGIDAEALVREKAGLTWIGISGYGRREPQASWIAFGDDAGVAAGLCDIMKAAIGRYEFAGDAIADPLTGMQAALAGWKSWLRGGGRLVSLSLVDVAARCLHDELSRSRSQVIRSFAAWWAHWQRGDAASQAGARPVVEHVARTGEDTAAVLGELGIPC